MSLVSSFRPGATGIAGDLSKVGPLWVWESGEEISVILSILPYMAGGNYRTGWTEALSDCPEMRSYRHLWQSYILWLDLCMSVGLEAPKYTGGNGVCSHLWSRYQICPIELFDTSAVTTLWAISPSLNLSLCCFHCCLRACKSTSKLAPL